MILHSNIIGDGKPFIILHGLFGMGDNWKTLGRRFSERGYQVHLVDQRNHGRSFHSKTFNYNVLADDLKKYCDCHRLEDLVLLGHSMGGKTAMQFVSKNPEMVSKLIVADISPKFYPLHHQEILKAFSALDFSIVKTRKIADEVISKYIRDLGVRQFLAKNLYWKYQGELSLRINLPALIENIEEVGKALDEKDVFNGDTLFLRGEKSGYIGIGDKDLIKKHFPNATTENINNAGHWLHAENPKDFYNVVMDFISL